MGRSADESGFNSRRTDRLTPTQPPIQWITENPPPLHPEVKATGTWTYTRTTPSWRSAWADNFTYREIMTKSRTMAHLKWTTNGNNKICITIIAISAVNHDVNMTERRAGEGRPLHLHLHSDTIHTRRSARSLARELHCQCTLHSIQQRTCPGSS